MSSYVGAFDCVGVPLTTKLGHTDDMTAIVATYTPDGFVIGADGLRRDTNGKVVTEAARKLYGIRVRDWVLVFAWAGKTHLLDQSGNVVFDFATTSQELLHAIGREPISDFPQLLARFCDVMFVQLLAKFGPRNSGNSNILTPGEISTALMVGYFKGEPSSGEISVRHNGAGFEKPIVQRLDLRSINIFSGSRAMFNIFRPNGEFKKEELTSVNDGVKLVREYIELCVRHRNSEPDCADIGGHIHIAKVSPRGVLWIDQPIM
jgi:hypothetical protein